jgi:hypothetical protein
MYSYRIVGTAASISDDWHLIGVDNSTYSTTGISFATSNSYAPAVNYIAIGW